MNSFTRYFAAAAALGGLSAPLVAQNPYPSAYGQGYQQQAYGYPQQAYGYQQQGYPQQGYGSDQGYTQNPVGQIINSLLGNRYTVTDRQAVSQCASAAISQAAAQYGNGYNRSYANNGYNRGYANNGYNRGYANNGYNRGYANNSYNVAMRVTSITEVQRRSNGLRVSGTMSSGYGGRYENPYGYQNRNIDASNVSFRCNVDYRGAVTNVRIGRNMAYTR